MSLHEECGIIGIAGPVGQNYTRDVYYGLSSLQHRGQQSCGIAVSHDGDVDFFKDNGLVSDVFTAEILDGLDGNIAVGHVRYPAAGTAGRVNAQPLVTTYRKGTLTIAHNGTLHNANELRKQLHDTGAVLNTLADSELIANFIARSRMTLGSAEEAVRDACANFHGSYSLLVMSPRKLIAARDPYGVRPLLMGRRGEAVVFASESCALDVIGATYERDVEPGEVVCVSKEGIKSFRMGKAVKPRHCIFEYIYFSRADSTIDGHSVAKARTTAGRHLARQHPVDADVVIGVPDSGLEAAMGYSLESGIPYDRGFVKNSYIGRTFIRPTQDERELAVRLKLNPIGDAVKGKRVVMIDDSIVRGTTCAQIVNLLRQAGATEVHIRIASPPFLYPCYYGTDVPSRENLAAVKYGDNMNEFLGTDSVGYLSLDSLPSLIGCDHYCDACFTGDYLEYKEAYHVD